MFIAHVTVIPAYLDNPEQSFCVYHFDNRVHEKIFHTVSFVGFYCLPLGIIAGCYFVMAASNYLQWRPGSTGAIGRQARSRRRIAKTVAAVVATFAICWFPFHALDMYKTYADRAQASDVANSVVYVTQIVAHCMSYANSAANPFVYAFMSSDFRRAFKQTFLCRKYHDQFSRASIQTQSNHKITTL